jgi:hypothetical protein
MIDTENEIESETEREFEDEVVAPERKPLPPLPFLRPLPSRFALGLSPKTLRVLGNKMSSGRGASGARSAAPNNTRSTTLSLRFLPRPRRGSTG